MRRLSTRSIPCPMMVAMMAYGSPWRGINAYFAGLFCVLWWVDFAFLVFDLGVKCGLIWILCVRVLQRIDKCA